jgi:25S rRNA (uracil2634-N3)-methyltransferase
MKNLITTDENEIGKLIGSSAYQNSSHRNHKSIHQKVTDWFAFHYGHQPVQTDATGRTIAPSARKTSLFVSQIQEGNTLFVGEGNLSFALSIAKMPSITSSKLTATTYEKTSDLSEEAQQNSEILKQSRVSVINGVDATKLDRYFSHHKFDTIVFQFPNAGSREPEYGRNPNYILIRNFLKSAATCLDPNGKILITAVDSPHYQGAFQFEEAAENSGYRIIGTYPFDPESFPGYSHTNTNDDDSALEKHDDFKTWIFELKK